MYVFFIGLSNNQFLDSRTKWSWAYCLDWLYVIWIFKSLNRLWNQGTAQASYQSGYINVFKSTPTEYFWEYYWPSILLLSLTYTIVYFSNDIKSKLYKYHTLKTCFFCKVVIRVQRMLQQPPFNKIQLLAVVPVSIIL